MKKVILAIGLNYKDSDYFLPDCELDAKKVSAIYFQNGYTPYLFDQMTVIQFQKIMMELAAEKLDELVVYFSGHGTQIFDGDSSEQDKYEEALCFWDGKRIQLLYDQDFADLVNGTAKKVTVIMDCCHSGGMSRMVATPGHRIKKITYIKRMLIERVQPIQTKSINKPLFVFASQESQVSYSTGDGGAFTKVFLAALESGMTVAKEIVDYARESINFQYATLVGDGTRHVISRKGEEEETPIELDLPEEIKQELLKSGTYEVAGVGTFQVHKAWNKIRVRLQPNPDFRQMLHDNWHEKL